MKKIEQVKLKFEQVNVLVTCLNGQVGQKLIRALGHLSLLRMSLVARALSVNNFTFCYVTGRSPSDKACGPLVSICS